MFRLSPVFGLRPVRGGAAPGAEGAEAGDAHILAPGQGLSDRLEHGIDGIPGRRSSNIGPAGYTTGGVRFVHPISPCLVAFSERPACPTDHSRRSPPRLARSVRPFDPGSGRSAPFLPERRLRRFARHGPAVQLQAFEVGVLRAVRGAEERVPRASTGETDPCPSTMPTFPEFLRRVH